MKRSWKLSFFVFSVILLTSNYGNFPQWSDPAYFQSSGSVYWTSSVTAVSSDVAWGRMAADTQNNSILQYVYCSKSAERMEP